MLWYKSWHDTRWRFLIGLVLLAGSAASTVAAYPQVVKLLAAVPNLNLDGAIGREVAASAALARTYRGYVFSQWFLQNMPQMWGAFAVIIGTGGLVSQSARGGGLFTLSLPVSRHQLVAVRAATGLSELMVLAFVPSLLLPVLSPTVGQTYAVSDALIHATCLFIAGSVFFSLTFLLSSMFDSVWPPLLIVLCAATLMSLAERLSPEIARYGLFHIVGAESYYRGEGLPLGGLVVTALASAAMLYGAAMNIARHDF